MAGVGAICAMAVEEWIRKIFLCEESGLFGGINVIYILIYLYLHKLL